MLPVAEVPEVIPAGEPICSVAPAARVNTLPETTLPPCKIKVPPVSTVKLPTVVVPLIVKVLPEATVNEP